MRRFKMPNLYFNHNKVIKKYQPIDKKIKFEALDYCTGIKNLYKDNKEITKMLDKIALDIQKLTNKGKMSDQDLYKFIQLLKDNDFGYLDCYQIINSLLILSKHQNTIFGRKFNFFGVNQTNHIYDFIHNKLSESNMLFSNQDRVINESIKGILKINIGIVYLNPNAIREGIKDLNLAYLLTESKTHYYGKTKLEIIYKKMIQDANNVILKIEKDFPKIYNVEKFNNYLYELLKTL